MTEKTLTLSFVAVILLAGIVFLVASFVIKQHETHTVSALTERIESSAVKMRELAATIDRDGGNEQSAAIARDCAQIDRARFDTLLANLATLHGKDLTEVSSLFAACGDYFAVQRSVMLQQLEQVFSSYSDYISLLEPYDGRAALRYPVAGWQTLITLEQDRLRSIQALVDIQGTIIAILNNKSQSTDVSIDTLVVQAQTIQKALAEVGTQIDIERNKLQ